MPNAKLTVATCQIAVSADPAANGTAIRQMIGQAAVHGADVVHVGECALCGYCRMNFKSWDGYDWDTLRAATLAVLEACRAHGIWGIIGCSHGLTAPNFPHNSVYVIRPDGTIADRYDKRRCSGGDVTCYTPGDHPVTLEVKGVRCGVAICLEENFPDLWQAYADDGVTLVFHSTSVRVNDPDDSIASDRTRFLAQANAEQYQLFISAAGWCPSGRPHPGLWVSRRGIIDGQSYQPVPGLILNSIPDDEEKDAFFAMVRRFRASARDGSYYRDHMRTDPRSSDRTSP
jgi:predicted amidohydrolase